MHDAGAGDAAERNVITGNSPAASSGVRVGGVGTDFTVVAGHYIGTPADGDSVIAVGATTLAGAKAGFSSFGPTADGRTKPDVSAPGAGAGACRRPAKSGARCKCTGLLRLQYRRVAAL